MRPTGAVLAGLTVTLAACAEADLGPCDEAAARTVVYGAPGTSQAGLAAYAGQALLVTSCGNGSYCHSAGADLAPAHRFGVPRGLDFDVAPIDGSPSRVERLRTCRARVVEEAREVWGLISAGEMPPGGSAETQAVPADTQWVVPGTAGDVPLGALATERERVRAWLACGAPVVERSEPDCAGVSTSIGDCVPSRGVP